MSAREKPADLDARLANFILEGVQDAIFVIDTQGYVLYANPAANYLFALDDAIEGALDTADFKHYAAESFEITTMDGEPVAADSQPLILALNGEALRDTRLLVRHSSEERPRVYAFTSERIECDPPLHILMVRDETDTSP